MTAHANCTHPATKAARAACRRAAAKATPAPTKDEARRTARRAQMDADRKLVTDFHIGDIVQLKGSKFQHVIEEVDSQLGRVLLVQRHSPVRKARWSDSLKGMEVIFSEHAN